MPNIYSKIATEMEPETRNLTNALDILTTKMSKDEQFRQQNDCLTLIREYGITPRYNINTHTTTYYRHLCNFNSRAIIETSFLDYSNLIYSLEHNNELRNGEDTVPQMRERIYKLYDDVIRMVTLETKQIITHLNEERQKIENDIKTEEKSRTFDLTNIYEHLGPDVMGLIKSYMPIDIMAKAYMLGLKELKTKILDTRQMTHENRSDMYEIAYNIMTTRREQVTIKLMQRYNDIKSKRAISGHTETLFRNIIKNNTRVLHGSKIQQVRKILWLIGDCLEDWTRNISDDCIRNEYKKMGMEFTDLINHVYNCRDSKKISYFIENYTPKGTQTKKTKAKKTNVNENDYKKIKYLYETVGESWAVIAAHFGNNGNKSKIKNIYIACADKEIKELLFKNKGKNTSSIMLNRGKKQLDKYSLYNKYGLTPERLEKYIGYPPP
jgi:hypothetical protein